MKKLLLLLAVFSLVPSLFADDTRVYHIGGSAGSLAGGDNAYRLGQDDDIAMTAENVGRKPEDFCIYGIEICLPSPENSVRNPIHYQLYDKCDEYGCPLYVLCDENGNPLVALFVG